MEKDNLYHIILESLQSPECPACSYQTRSIEKYFDDLLYESSSDVGFIIKFRRNKGMCNYHAHKLADYKNGLAVASLYSYVSKIVIRELKNLNLKRPRPGKRVNCQACESIGNMEKNYLSAFKEFIFEDEFKDAFLASNGLCYPHYLNLIDLYKKNVPDWLNSFQISKLETLHAKITDYLKFQNYSLGEDRPDLTREEQLIYQKAVEFYSGYKGMKY